MLGSEFVGSVVGGRAAAVQEAQLTLLVVLPEGLSDIFPSEVSSHVRERRKPCF